MGGRLNKYINTKFFEVIANFLVVLSIILMKQRENLLFVLYTGEEKSVWILCCEISNLSRLIDEKF